MAKPNVRLLARQFFQRKMKHAAPERTPESLLGVAVINQAYIDWERLGLFKEKEPFFDTHNRMFKLWCGVAGLNPNYVVESFSKCQKTLTNMKKIK
jgi:predicted metallopeptidase